MKSLSLPGCDVHFVADLVILKERFRRPRIMSDHCQIRNNFSEREIKSAQQNDGDPYGRAGGDQQNYATKQSEESRHPREMDNKRPFQLAMSWAKHAPIAIARRVPVCCLPRFIFPLNCLRRRFGYDAVAEIPTTGIFLSRF
jgi:hypothetical protein